MYTYALVIYKTQKYSTVFTDACHWTLSSASRIQHISLTLHFLKADFIIIFSATSELQML